MGELLNEYKQMGGWIKLCVLCYSLLLLFAMRKSLVISGITTTAALPLNYSLISLFLCYKFIIVVALGGMVYL